MIDQLTGSDYQTYLDENFYQPLGCHTLGYLPKENNYVNAIVPTEMDSVFRKTLVKGWVHDENAALLGGVSGNAGLFANTHSLLPVLEMLLNGGEYQGKKFLENSTVETFTQIQFKENKLHIKFVDKFKFRRGRINCSLNDDNGWRWLGIQFSIEN